MASCAYSTLQILSVWWQTVLSFKIHVSLILRMHLHYWQEICCLKAQAVSWVTLYEVRPRAHFAGETWKWHFHSQNASNVFRPHYAGEIWKWRFHCQNASNVFHPHYDREFWKRNNYRSFRIYVWGRFGQGNQVIIIFTSTFSKSSVFKMFSVHTKTQRRRFEILLLWKAFSKSAVFVPD